jgi:enoyl-CoA hydratase
MDEVLCERRGAGAWLRLNRPESMNTITPAMTGALADHLDRVRVDTEIRALVITGSGRAFCAGGDLTAARALAEMEPPGGQQFLADFGAVLNSLQEFPKPVIAAVNGLTMAGGLELVLACDLVVAVASAPIGDGHANYGLIPGGGGSIRLPRRVGRSMAAWLFFTGRTLPARDLVACGLVNVVTESDELTATVDEVVASIATKSALGLARMKRLMNDGLDQPSSAGIRTELLASEAHAMSYDMAEGLAAFEAKRPPRFLGR